MAQFVGAAIDASHFPRAILPEIAFLGRSNVGKSSVINSLLGQKLAHTSSTPGRTRSINFFSVRWQGRPQPELWFTDLPGYGYARLSKEISAEWPKFIDPYLTHRASLALCFTLVDANVAPQASDRQLVEFLQANDRKLVMVATKSDKLSGNNLHKAMHTLGKAYEGVRIIPFSAKTGAGKEQLWQAIREAVESYPGTSATG